MRLTHQLRAAHDAILVGIGTVLADNPRLTVRLVEGENPQPVILDSRLRTPLESHLSQHPKPPWIVTTEGAPRERQAELESAGMQVWRLPTSPQGWVDLSTLLARLAERGVETLMVEGGAGVITSFLSTPLADQVIITIAPVFLGGLHAVESLPLPPNHKIQPRSNLEEHLPHIKDIQSLRRGEDLVVWGRLA
jgi:3,4-dihydroxy 2-butanone 4-phosphate synthase/GTP cyclohydrolase II